MTDPATLEFRDVSKRYGDGPPVIHDLSFEVGAGEICVLVGPSGCGKTTAMRMVNRMVEITSGDILIGGRSVRQRNAARLRRDIGYVIQQVGLFPHQTIAGNIAAVPKLLGWDRHRIAARVDELLVLVGLDPEDMRDRYPAQLSGGQRQRVGVARALAVDPPLMLMDEPFGAIDPINRERLQNEFLRLQAQLERTVVFVTHDIDEAIKMGDRIAIMKTGGILAQYASPAELLSQPADEFVEDFVGADRALKRLSLLRVRDVNLWHPPLVREGEPTAAARERAARSEVPFPLLIDADGRPLGWLSERDLSRETVQAPADSMADPVIDRDDVLRDALAELLQAGTQYAPVVDPRGAVVGVLSVALVSHLLTSGDLTEEPPTQRATVR
ncbi:ABC transporter ATP-binding protein [Capillimicrobium parvum]|uniref:ABC-type quaternary amine transporter n=1 Tax=Capillimicrobium parvum TaxID=2884022 RepID=A0A9E6XZ63_9ACTN|nr:ABC transporter ATP-binding protein [Capillimicrobium parvum]UGS36652.1 Osmoprotectant import ATP-binding protein OsmV [Capillimicrobium parvum]